MKIFHRMAVAGSVSIIAIASMATSALAVTYSDNYGRKITNDANINPRGSASSSHATGTQKRAEIQAKLDERRQKIIRSYTEHLVKVLNAAVERLTNIADRVGTRLDKMSASGANQIVNVTLARTKLETARTKIAEAKTAINGITNAIETTVTSDDPKKNFESAKTIITAAREKIKAAHAALVDVINSIKPGSNRATTTPHGQESGSNR